MNRSKRRRKRRRRSMPICWRISYFIEKVYISESLKQFTKFDTLNSTASIFLRKSFYWIFSRNNFLFLASISLAASNWTLKLLRYISNCDGIGLIFKIKNEKKTVSELLSKKWYVAFFYISSNKNKLKGIQYSSIQYFVGGHCGVKSKRQKEMLLFTHKLRKRWV